MPLCLLNKRVRVNVFRSHSQFRKYSSLSYISEHRATTVRNLELVLRNGPMLFSSVTESLVQLQSFMGTELRSTNFLLVILLYCNAWRNTNFRPLCILFFIHLFGAKTCYTKGRFSPLKLDIHMDCVLRLGSCHIKNFLCFLYKNFMTFREKIFFNERDKWHTLRECGTLIITARGTNGYHQQFYVLM
jgi:hypothetical protein